MSTSPIRVFIADAQPIVLEGLHCVLKHYASIQIIGEATDGSEAIEKVVNQDPDVVLLDLKMPRVDGLTALRSIKSRAPRSKVVMFASSEQKDDFVEAMKLGCSAILLKDAPTSLIEKSIQKVHAGEIWLDSNTTAAVIRQFASPAEFVGLSSHANGKTIRELAQLSQREREIIVLIAQGYKNKEIAEKDRKSVV